MCCALTKGRGTRERFGGLSSDREACEESSVCRLWSFTSWIIHRSIRFDEQVRSILRKLPKHFITGVISGRSLAKIRAFVDVPGLFYAGSHGFEILAPHYLAAGFGSNP